MTLLPIEKHGFVIQERIVAMGRADAASLRRIVSETTSNYRIDLTFGAKRQTIIILDTGHLVITALTLEEIEQLVTIRS